MNKIICGLLIQAAVFAAPSGMSVSAGSAHVCTEGIKTSDKAILNWHDFSIGKGESVRFLQPDHSSSCLNRVTSSQMSQILGKLESNGKVYLINPNGLFIGPDAVIDTAGFIGSTFDVLDEDYLKGTMNFSHESDAKIVHLGKINCPDGEVTLFAKQIDNEGEITGTDILLKADGSYIRPDSELNGSHTYAYGVRSSGTVEAVASETRDGRIYLISENARTEVTGDLSATHEVVVLGDQVSVFEKAEVTAGEKLLIGGDYQGKNPEIKNSTMTYVGEEVVLTAHEGRVIVWSDGVTGFFGHADTSGDKNGGFIEVSGAQNLSYCGSTNRSAKNGDPGTLLLDPTDITITGAATSGGSFIAGVFTPTGASANIFSGDLATELAGGPVTVSTVSGFGGLGNISVTSGFTWSTRNLLTLNAERALTFSGGITISNTDAGATTFPCIDFRANVAGTGTGTFTAITLSSAIIEADSGDISMRGDASGTGFLGIGIRANFGGIIRSNGIGRIRLTGTGSPGFSACPGLVFLFGSSVTTVDGDVRITGVGGGTGGTFNQGILAFSGATFSASGLGGFDLTGTGGGSLAGGILFNSATLSTTSGDISFDGTGGGTVGANNGVSLVAGASVTSTSGDIDFVGTGGLGTVGQNGISIANSSLVSTVSGAITFDGTGGMGTTANNGVAVISNGSVRATGTGTIDITGRAASGTTTNHGVFVSGVASEIETDSGDITIDGTGFGSSSNNVGVAVTSSGAIQSTSGAIDITGVGASSTDDNYGVWVSGSTSEITSSGNVTLTGNENISTGSENTGVRIEGEGSVSTTGSGILTIDGTGSPGTGGNNEGILITGLLTTVTVDDGNAFITGTGKGTGTGNGGVEISDSGSVLSTGDGDCTITGQGSLTGSDSNHGVLIDSGPVLSLAGGDIVINGTAGGVGLTNCGIAVESSGVVSSSAGDGDLSLTGVGGAGTTGNDGIMISGLGSTVVTSSGMVTLTGTGGNGTDDNPGIVVDDFATVVTATGGISAVGVGVGSSDTSAGILVDDAGRIESTASGTLSLDGTGETGVFVTVSSTAGTEIESDTGVISIIGRAASTSERGIVIDKGALVTSSTSAPINLQTFSDLLLEDRGQVVGGSSPVTINVDRDFTIIGTNPVTTPTGVLLADGDAIISVGRNLTLIAGGGDDMGGPAQIGSNNPLALTSTANITFTRIGGNVLLHAPTVKSYAAIGHGNPSFAAPTYTGNIDLSNVSGNVTLLGASGGIFGPAGFAQIGHLDSIGGTVSGDIDIKVGNSIFVEGGTFQSSSIARIGHGSMNTVLPGQMTLIADFNINVSSSAGEAQIVNENGFLTLVVDNLFPTPFGIGSGEFNLNSLLSATGELRIYTAQQSQNSINDLINGIPYIQGPFNVDTATEQFGVYFPGGNPPGLSYTIYYKLSEAFAFPSIRLLTIANAQLTDLLPFTFPVYHGDFCFRRRCDPNFDPYFCFIYENDLYWIGESQRPGLQKPLPRLKNSSHPITGYEEPYQMMPELFWKDQTLHYR